MLYEFLLMNEKEILAMTEAKALDLAGIRPSSIQLKKGLPIFYEQLKAVLKLEAASSRATLTPPGQAAMAEAACDNDEPGIAEASGRPGEAELAVAAGIHGTELLRLGYTLSHVVHAYGSMCQAITELASKKKISVTPDEFHDLSRCLDIAIAGAVTTYQSIRNTEISNREVESLGVLAHELRNALATVKLSIELIKNGTVGFKGSTGQVLDQGLNRMEELIDRSLTEVRLRVDPKVHSESVGLLQLVNQIAVTAEIEARSRDQSLVIQIDPKLVIQADQQLIYSALSNMIQNALKYTHVGGRINVRASSLGENTIVEVEDECGGLSDIAVDLFRPFEQQNENREGLGLGLTIAQRAAALNRGKIVVRNLPGKGCIFQMMLPNPPDHKRLQNKPVTSAMNH